MSSGSLSDSICTQVRDAARNVLLSLGKVHIVADLEGKEKLRQRQEFGFKQKDMKQNLCTSMCEAMPSCKRDLERWGKREQAQSRGFLL